jgi:hypothetical protein
VVLPSRCSLVSAACLSASFLRVSLQRLPAWSQLTQPKLRELASPRAAASECLTASLAWCRVAVSPCHSFWHRPPAWLLFCTHCSPACVRACPCVDSRSACLRALGAPRFPIVCLLGCPNSHASMPAVLRLDSDPDFLPSHRIACMPDFRRFLSPRQRSYHPAVTPSLLLACLPVLPVAAPACVPRLSSAAHVPASLFPLRTSVLGITCLSVCLHSSRLA